MTTLNKDSLRNLMVSAATGEVIGEAAELFNQIDGTGKVVMVSADEAEDLLVAVEAAQARLEAIAASIRLTEEPSVAEEAGGLISWIKRTYSGRDEDLIETINEEIAAAGSDKDKLKKVLKDINTFEAEAGKIMRNEATLKHLAKIMLPGGILATVASEIYIQRTKKKVSAYRDKLIALQKKVESKIK